MSDVLEDIGLTRCPNFFRDREFLAALAVGVMFWLGLACLNSNPRVAGWTLSIVLSLCLFQPAVEELIFRGVIQSEVLRQRWGQPRRLGFSTANWLTSLAFAGFHFFPYSKSWRFAQPLSTLLLLLAS